MDAEAMLTVDEISMRLRVSRGAVYGLVRADILPAIRVGRRIRVAQRVLENFIEVGGAGWPGGWRKRVLPSPGAKRLNGARRISRRTPEKTSRN